MFTKAKIFNLALSALLLRREITNADTDTSNEGKVLLNHYDIAFRSTLEDMDLDSTSTQQVAQLVATFDQNAVPLLSQWMYAYKYPDHCAFFRRVQSAQVIDNRSSHVPKRVGMYQGQKVIFCNQDPPAIIEFIPYDLPLPSLIAPAGLAVAYKLAMLSAPLITGKGAARLIKDIEEKYVKAKAEAQAQDARENFSFQTDATMSEFVESRLS